MPTSPWQKDLDEIRQQNLWRLLVERSPQPNPHLREGQRAILNFGSNDYLGLASEPSLIEAGQAALEAHGVGSTSSRLIGGTSSAHRRLEEHIAQWKGTERSLTFSSGYATATGALPALFGERDIIFSDALNHACLIDGMRLSRARIIIYPHNDLQFLCDQLQALERSSERPEKIAIVTESIFSMDGDRAPVKELVALKERYRCLLLLDEAHATGLLGARGSGLAEALDIAEQVDLQMGTLSKAIGVQGGYLAASHEVIELLVQRARSFIFSTAPPPAIAAIADAAIHWLNTAAGEERRQKLWANIHLWSKMTSQPPESSIFPWIIGEEVATLDASRKLWEAGFYVPPIRFPTVARGSARLRISLSAAHHRSDILALGNALVHSK